MAFEKNVFLNCPFDQEYKLILKPLLFTLRSLGFYPKISETLDSGEARVKGIEKLIEDSKYSIHDLSRMQASAKNELARFNMPFELGLDLGCKRFKGGIHAEKRCLILDEEKYRYQKAISDLSGNDISFHGSEPENAVREVRNWFQKLNPSQKLPSAGHLWTTFNEFSADFYKIMQHEKFNEQDVEHMPWSEFYLYINEWLKGHGYLES
jgi:hypothetical protein